MSSVVDILREVSAAICRIRCPKPRQQIRGTTRSWFDDRCAGPAPGHGAVDPSQWEGWTSGDGLIHVRFRYGRLWIGPAPDWGVTPTTLFVARYSRRR
jgi:hypothetical protein